MTDNIAIRVSHLGKKYSIGRPQEKYHTFRDAIVDSLKAPLKVSRGTSPDKGFWALYDISFEVEQGEVVGIIGRNGAGKSTLLKILSRVTSPTIGTAEIHGQVGSLLEVGTGFHPEMTGRENIFLNGSILGMKRQDIESKFDDIVKFSEVEEFIDTPVKRYSSGMYVRLAFAVAAHLNSKILVVDEVLAVGDYEFQKKCLRGMETASTEGRTILFVSHNLSAIATITKRCIVLEKGAIKFDGKSIDAIEYYTKYSQPSLFMGKKPGEISYKINQGFRAQIVKVSISDDSGAVKDTIYYQSPINISIQFRVIKLNWDAYVGLTIHNARHERILLTTDDDVAEGYIPKISNGIHEYSLTIPGKILTPGTYYLSYFIGPYIDIEHNYELEFEIVDYNSRRAQANNSYNRGYYDYPISPEIEWIGRELKE